MLNFPPLFPLPDLYTVIGIHTQPVYLNLTDIIYGNFSLTLTILKDIITGNLCSFSQTLPLVTRETLPTTSPNTQSD